MTFYEAAIQVLLQAGQPLHASEIAKRAIQENLLSHVGKDPEATMASRLAAMARRSQDRRLVAVEPDTFGLTDWNLKTSPEALEQSGLPEVHDEEEPPLRPRERHPTVDKDKVRIAGRGERRRRHEEIERKRRKRLGPVEQYVFELLGKLGRPAPLFELAAAVRDKDLVADDLGREALGELLAAENQRREGEGRRPLFALYDDGLAGLRGGPEPQEGEEPDWAALVEEAARALAEERKPQPRAAAPAPQGQVERAVQDSRQRAIRQLRRRLQELDASGLEAITSAMLEAMGYRDIRVAKRHKDGALFTTRRRMGLAEVRFAVRVIRGGREVRREEIAELRRDMASHSAQLGVIVSPNDVTREAKNEASQASQPLVTLLCADALSDQLAERGIGVATRTVQYVDFDEAAFRGVLRSHRSDDADEEPPGRRNGSAQERRERRERERKESRERRERAREERRRQRGEERASAEEGEAEEEMRPEAEKKDQARARRGEEGAAGDGAGDEGRARRERAAPAAEGEAAEAAGDEPRTRREDAPASGGEAAAADEPGSGREAASPRLEDEGAPIGEVAPARQEEAPGASRAEVPAVEAGEATAAEGHAGDRLLAAGSREAPVETQEAEQPTARPPSGDES